MPRKTVGIDEFIQANHESLTVCEMAKEYGVSEACMSINCSRLGIAPISAREKRVKFIIDHPTWRAEKIAEALDCAPGTIGNIIRKDNLRPKKEKCSIEPIKSKQRQIGSLVTAEPVMKVVHKEDPLTSDQRRTIAEFDAKINKTKVSRRSFAEYNQTRSPFGIADELRGIKATKEPQEFYLENVRL